jgi:hypothetical protein
MRVLVVQRAQPVRLRWANQRRAHLVPSRIECHSEAGAALKPTGAPAGSHGLPQPVAASASPARPVDITPRWRPLRRIVSSFPYVIIAGLLYVVFSSAAEW